MTEFEKKVTRIELLHDLKRIAIAINELVRDLDKVERQEKDKAETN